MKRTKIDHNFHTSHTVTDTIETSLLFVTKVTSLKLISEQSFIQNTKITSSECQSLLQQHSRHNLEYFIYRLFMNIFLHYNDVNLLLNRNEGSCQNQSQFSVSYEILVASSVSVPMVFHINGNV